VANRLRGKGTPVKIQRILVPTDFSKSSKAAIAYAIDTARSTGARIHLIHAYGVPSVALGHAGAIGIGEVIGSLRLAASQKLDAVRKEVETAGVECGMDLSAMSPQDAIAAAALKTRADCVIMGTRGLTGIRHAIMGSVAERTLRTAPCPVLTVNGPAQAPPSIARKILVPSDFSPASIAALEIATEWGGPDSEIVLLHAHYEAGLIKPFAPQERSADSPSHRELQARMDETVRAVAVNDGRISTRIEEGVSESTAILLVAAEPGFDLIVMGTHGRSGLPHLVMGSVAERVLREAKCPIVAIKVADPVSKRTGAAPDAHLAPDLNGEGEGETGSAH
jgi:nucleotide-binding universal stress UspA family protein